MEQGRDSRSGHGGFRWRCPYCGTVRTNTLFGGSERQKAVAALRSHVLVSDDDVHGARYELPDLDALSLGEHVVSIDGRRDSGVGR